MHGVCVCVFVCVIEPGMIKMRASVFLGYKCIGLGDALKGLRVRASLLEAMGVWVNVCECVNTFRTVCLSSCQTGSFKWISA